VTDQQALRRQAGFTLIELMVAMVLGLLVAAGIITVFISTSSSNQAQNQLARLQEEGRFAITRLDGDLRMANGQYCSNSGGTAKMQSNGVYLDGLRAPTVYASNLNAALADLSTPMGTSPYPADPGAKYTFPSFLAMRGYDCTASTCTPANPSTAIAATTIPAMGALYGNRVKGADVLTVRYVNPLRGWAIDGGTFITASGNSLSSITVVPNTAIGEPPITDFISGDLAMLADCSNAQIFVADNASGVIGPRTASNHGTPSPQAPTSAPRLFDLNRDFQTVTYYLEVVSVNNNSAAPFTGALMRRVNGGTANANHGGSEDELVRGIERLDFKYAVEDANGNTSFLTAAQVDNNNGGTLTCPPAAPNPLGSDPGCLWRAIKSIEVSVLMDGQVPLYTLAANELMYAYSPDTSTPGMKAPDSHAITPVSQGFVNPMLRREFTALVSVRNFNP
jgi:type IV pilus assembly protein PilW